MLRILFHERESKVVTFLNSLQPSDIKTEEKYNSKIDQLRSSILLKPASVGPGKFYRSEFVTRSLTMQQKFSGMLASYYNHEIIFPCLGSSELFNYVPDGFPTYSSEHGLILPQGSQITVYVDLPQLENERAISSATDLLSVTKRLIESNNAEAEVWNIKVRAKIDELAAAKYKELTDKFGRGS